MKRKVKKLIKALEKCGLKVYFDEEWDEKLTYICFDVNKYDTLSLTFDKKTGIYKEYTP